MNNKTPTPITDAYIGSGQEDCMTEGEIAMCEFARKLERQLSAVTEQRDRLAESAKEGLASVDRAILDHSVYKGSRLDVAFQPLREALAAVKETTICGMKVVVDTSIPQNTAIFFDPKTGETLATLKGGAE